MGTIWLQQLIVVVAVLAAALYCAWRFLPRKRAALGRWLDRDERPMWLRRFGTRYLSAGASCDDGCGSCGNCGPAQPHTVHAVRMPERTPRPDA